MLTHNATHQEASLSWHNFKDSPFEETWRLNRGDCTVDMVTGNFNLFRRCKVCQAQWASGVSDVMRNLTGAVPLLGFNNGPGDGDDIKPDCLNTRLGTIQCLDEHTLKLSSFAKATMNIGGMSTRPRGPLFRPISNPHFSRLRVFQYEDAWQEHEYSFGKDARFC